MLKWILRITLRSMGVILPPTKRKKAGDTATSEIDNPSSSLKEQQAMMDSKILAPSRLSPDAATPPCEWIETDEVFQIALDVSEVCLDELDVSLHNDGGKRWFLTLQGLRRKQNGEVCKFSRSFALHRTVDVASFTSHLEETDWFVLTAPKNRPMITTKEKSRSRTATEETITMTELELLDDDDNDSAILPPVSASS